jgi:glycerol kinase
LTGGAVHRCDAGNASRTLLYDVQALDWAPELLHGFGVPRSILPDAVSSDAGFGRTAGLDRLPDGVPILAVLADSHAALFGHGCTNVGTGKATYGTGSSIMAPVEARGPSAASGPPADGMSERADGLLGSSRVNASDGGVPTTLAWVIEGRPTYALEGNILSSGAALAWTAATLNSDDVRALLALAETVPDAGGVTLVPAFTGLGAPYWDRKASGLISGLAPGSGPAQIARAAVDAVAHQICDVVKVVEARTGPIDLRVDGGPTTSRLLMQTQADLLGRAITVADVAEVSALGVAKLAWQVAGHGGDWVPRRPGVRFRPKIDEDERSARRTTWATEIDRARFPDAEATRLRGQPA